MTPKELTIAIEAFTTKNHRTPTAKELGEVLGDKAEKKKLPLAIARYKKSLVSLTVLDGKVFDKDGNTIWHQASAGSMMPARFYEDEGQGALITH